MLVDPQEMIPRSHCQAFHVSIYFIKIHVGLDFIILHPIKDIHDLYFQHRLN